MTARRFVLLLALSLPLVFTTCDQTPTSVAPDGLERGPSFKKVPAPSANATVLGLLPGGFAGNTADVNNAGQIVGHVYIQSGPSSIPHAVIWDNDTEPTALPESPGAVSSVANGINSSGQIVGAMRFPQGSHAVLWNNGVTTDLGAGGATDINDIGQVVGQAPFGSIGQAALWQSGSIVPTNLGSLIAGQNSQAQAINNNGQVVGHSNAAGGVRHAVLWEPGVGIADIHPGLAQSFAADINDAGQVVGHTCCGSGNARAFIWEAGQSAFLPMLPGADVSAAYGINEAGDITGWGRIDSFSRAWLWQDEGVMELGANRSFERSFAYAISDNQQVAGEVGDKNDLHGKEGGPAVWNLKRPLTKD